ncbi:MAG: hypothetical protein Ct9H300mP8_11970 [Gammaproteobacteria bacterium]|nr:MAG: hypothetical protein Ct9H300mP8_11970 [Gammaproteobacteria bacterium]
MNARFSKPVIPGDTLTVSMWVDGSNALFRTTNQDGDVVIDQGGFYVRLIKVRMVVEAQTWPRSLTRSR